MNYQGPSLSRYSLYTTEEESPMTVDILYLVDIHRPPASCQGWSLPSIVLADTEDMHHNASTHFRLV